MSEEEELQGFTELIKLTGGSLSRSKGRRKTLAKVRPILKLGRTQADAARARMDRFERDSSGITFQFALVSLFISFLALFRPELQTFVFGVLPLLGTLLVLVVVSMNWRIFSGNSWSLRMLALDYLSSIPVSLEKGPSSEEGSTPVTPDLKIPISDTLSEK